MNLVSRVSSIAVATLSLAGVAVAQDSGIELGKTAPPATVQTLDGKAADLSQFVGKGPVLMEFWAIWCENCHELEPTMKAMYAKYGKQVAFVGVAVSVSQESALVKRYVANHKLPWTQVYDTHGNATDAYDVPATSYVVVVDKSGKVVYTGVGGKQDLETALKKAVSP
jgi:cytochrome c biogenesis protein CcmG/thiol:disulfide interchange protein DsbE